MDTKIMNSTANPNPNPNKPITTMAFHFTRALANINRNTPKSSSFHRRRRCRITRAAYASMAVAAGPKRAWSRALLRMLRSRRPNYKRANTNIINLTRTRPARVSGSSRVDSLRSLVPGGEAMGLCRLLEESASYIQCLSTQVTIMQRIVDSVST